MSMTNKEYLDKFIANAMENKKSDPPDPSDALIDAYRQSAMRYQNLEAQVSALDRELKEKTQLIGQLMERRVAELGKTSGILEAVVALRPKDPNDGNPPEKKE